VTGKIFSQVLPLGVDTYTHAYVLLLPDRGHLADRHLHPFYLHNPTVRSPPAMDDYQKHLERQLQQQHLQLRGQTTDPNPPRNFQPLLLQQQRVQPLQPQWTPNIITGQMPTSAAPGPAGFGRGLAGSPVAMGVGAAQPQVMAQITQVQQNAFSPSSQPQAQSVHSPAQPTSQKSRSSPAPGSPHPADSRTWHLFDYAHPIETEKLRISTILEINSHLIKICLSLQSMVPPQNIAADPTYSG
jgi:hypothetical protein